MTHEEKPDRCAQCNGPRRGKHRSQSEEHCSETCRMAALHIARLRARGRLRPR